MVTVKQIEVKDLLSVWSGSTFGFSGSFLLRDSQYFERITYLSESKYLSEEYVEQITDSHAN